MKFKKKAMTAETFSYIIALIIGGLVAYFLITWALDMGVGELLKKFMNMFKW
tara:strand:+ start:189 stop:344 length:156 start_codon:yes stop_codon:yes gene_type:complete